MSRIEWVLRCQAPSFVNPAYRCDRAKGHGPNGDYCAKHAEPMHQARIASAREALSAANNTQRKDR